MDGKELKPLTPPNLQFSSFHSSLHPCTFFYIKKDKVTANDFVFKALCSLTCHVTNYYKSDKILIKDKEYRTTMSLCRLTKCMLDLAGRCIWYICLSLNHLLLDIFISYRESETVHTIKVCC